MECLLKLFNYHIVIKLVVMVVSLIAFLIYCVYEKLENN